MHRHTPTGFFLLIISAAISLAISLAWASATWAAPRSTAIDWVFPPPVTAGTATLSAADPTVNVSVPIASAGAVLDSIANQPGRSLTVQLSLDHLNLLKDVIETPAGPLPVWYIYATPSARGYTPVEAPGEGIACVDDVARALIVYLEHYELTGDPDSLAHARDAITFLAYMRQDDGTYANFVDRHGHRNLTGITSRPGINWWMARAMWGLAKARVVFASVDPQYARWIDELLRPSVDLLAQAVQNATQGDPTQPAVIGGGNDVSAIFLMAISLLYSADPILAKADPGQSGHPADSSTLEQIATALALGLRQAQSGDAGTPPYRAVSPNPGAPAVWTGWGSHGMEALAMAGLIFNRPEWISWAAETAHALGSYLAAGPGALAAQGPAPIRFPQIAYDQSPLVRGLEWLHRATGKPLYSDLAFLGASWLFGNNPAHEPMHHLASGRTYDGIDGEGWDLPGRINYSSGAESTIEGLSILLALNRIEANGLIRTPALSRPRGEGPYVIEAETYLRPAYGRIETRRQDHLAGSRPSGDGFIIVHDGSELTLPLPPSSLRAGRYRIDLVHGSSRSNPATLYVLSGEEVLGLIHVGRDARGDRLRTTYVGEFPGQSPVDNPPASLRIYVEGGPLVVDAVVLHPVVMWRRLESPDGDMIALRNMTDEPQPFSLPRADIEGSIRAQVRLYDRHGIDVEDAGLTLPPYGFGFIADP